MTSIVEKLTSHPAPWSKDIKEYSLEELRSKVRKLIPLDNNHTYLALDWAELRKEPESWLEYALFEFSSDNTQQTETKLREIFHGCGNVMLREPRHTYFPDNGYVFYIPAKKLSKAFEELAKYFDFE